ncbi:MAG: ABC transporter permease [Chthoniobacterales bacterium]|nr:ABC transporter permease [Chthoniobacterales bacterium]
MICSVNYGAGGTRKLLEQIQRLGTNVLIVTPSKSQSVAGRAKTGQAVTTLTQRDYLALRRELLDRSRSSGLVSASFWTKTGDLSKNATVVGCEPDYFPIKNWDVTSGALFDSNQELSAARVALLGWSAATDLFGSESPIGRRLMINRVPFTVVGVLSERGQSLDTANEDTQIYVPLTTAMRRLMNVDYFSGIILEIAQLEALDASAATTHALLRQFHHLRAKQKDDFQIQNQKTLLDTQQLAADRLGFFLRWVGASALVVSGLGMLGITWIAVKERTRELGIRRALGASAGDIFAQMIFESAVVALTGCGLGLALSWPTSRLLSSSANYPFVFDRANAAVAFLAAGLLNIVFALWPSRQAASISPLTALKYE